MRRNGRSIAGLVAVLAVTAAGLVGATAAQAAVVPPNLDATVTPSIAYGGTTVVELDWDMDPAVDDTATVSVSPLGGTGCTGLAVNIDQCSITGLTAGTSYTFTVTVTDGSASITDTVAATPATVPQAPISATVTAGNTRAWIDWSAPATGGDPIIDYTVTTNPPGGSCPPGTDTECIITGLVNNTTYAVQVIAANSMGTSLPSTAVAVRPTATSGLPQAPTGVSAITTSPTAAEVSFTAPPAVVGFPLNSPSGFTATCSSSNGGATRTGTGSDSPITVSTLGTGFTYTCTVKAINANGDSAASSRSNAIATNNTAVPGAPTIGAPAGGSLQATVRWTPPSPLPVSPITTYQVSYLLGSGSWSSPITTGSTTTTYNLTDLEPGSYLFRVRAVNVGGAGAWSSASSPAVTVTSGTLNAPTDVKATPGMSAAALAWTAPTGGTLTPTGYEVRFAVSGTTAWSTPVVTGSVDATYTVSSGLTNGTAYVFQVRAVSGATASAWSASSTAVTPGKPGLPTGLGGSPGDARVALTWTAPAPAAGVPAPSGYEAQYSVSGTTTWLPITPLIATSASLTVTGLTNGTAYVFRVRSVNGPDVKGDWTTPSAALTPVSPIAKTIVIVGFRGTGSEDNMIFVDGIAEGLVGAKVTPYFRFPGQSGFTAGTGTRTIDANGDFSWQRKTGKRIVVEFRTTDVTSNRIVIQAR